MESQSESQLPINLSPEQIKGLSHFLGSECRDFLIKKIYVNSTGQVKAILKDDTEFKYYIVTMTYPNTWGIVPYYQPIQPIEISEAGTDFKTVFRKLKDKESKDYPVNLPPEEKGWTLIPRNILKSILKNGKPNKE